MKPAEEDLFACKDTLKREMEKKNQECIAKIRDLEVHYALERSPYNEGDIIQSGSTTIRIDTIEVEHFDWNYIEPYVVYHGEKLSNKLLKPTGKRGKITNHHFTSITKLN